VISDVEIASLLTDLDAGCGATADDVRRLVERLRRTEEKLTLRFLAGLIEEHGATAVREALRPRVRLNEYGRRLQAENLAREVPA
jgi:hypothetical protein